MHRFYLPHQPLGEAGERVSLPSEVDRQIKRVLRMRPGDTVTLFSGDGTEWSAILRSSDGRIAAELVEQRRPEIELPFALEAGIACLKGEKLDWVIQKSCELGATRVTLLRAERAIPAAAEERWERRLQRYGRIAVEACEQCGRVRIPDVSGPVSLDEALVSSMAGTKLLLQPGASPSLAECLRDRSGGVLLLCGPEGGFTPAEVETAARLGASPAGLGPRTLRAETAILAALAFVGAAQQ